MQIIGLLTCKTRNVDRDWRLHQEEALDDALKNTFPACRTRFQPNSPRRMALTAKGAAPPRCRERADWQFEVATWHVRAVCGV